MKTMKNKNKDYINMAKAFEDATKITVELVALPIIFLFVGIYLDRRFGSEPRLLLAGVVLGIVFGILRAIHLGKNIKLGK